MTSAYEGLLIGVSCRMAHQEPARARLRGAPMAWAAHSMTRWLASQGAAVVILPFAYPDEPLARRARQLVARCDAVVLQGGVDLDPRTYGQAPLRPEWSGDAARDALELSILDAALELDRPLLGICRGHQLLNAAMGGTLYQDIATQRPDAIAHVSDARYDRHVHPVTPSPGGALASWYGEGVSGDIISVHHQAIDRLGADLIVEATSPADQLIEAVRLDRADRFAVGVQWHPEFQRDEDAALLDPAPPLRALLDAALARR